MMGETLAQSAAPDAHPFVDNMSIDHDTDTSQHGGSSDADSLPSTPSTTASNKGGNTNRPTASRTLGLERGGSGKSSKSVRTTRNESSLTESPPWPEKSASKESQNHGAHYKPRVTRSASNSVGKSSSTSSTPRASPTKQTSGGLPAWAQSPPRSEDGMVYGKYDPLGVMPDKGAENRSADGGKGHEKRGAGDYLPTGKKKVKNARTAHGSSVKEPRRTKRVYAHDMVIITACDEEARNNKDFCETCGGVGRFLCCDSCPRSFHFQCVEPPLDINEIPEDSWFCNVCKAQRDPPPNSQMGVFRQLIDNVNRMNPTVFTLPDDLKNYFRGVGAGSNGEYIDTAEVKPVKMGRNGFVEEPDYARLKDKNGKFILCFKCKKSALHGHIISCDHCDLHWHMDCLDPPMVAPPPSTKKWMCPNHVEHVLPRRRKPKAQKSSIMTIDQTNPYVPNNGDIEVINEPDERIPADIFYVGNVQYRLPERAIKLNFLEKARRLRGLPSMELRPPHILENEPAASGQLQRPIEPELQEWLQNLSFFQQSSNIQQPQCASSASASVTGGDNDAAPDAMDEDGIRMLVRAALAADVDDAQESDCSSPLSSAAPSDASDLPKCLWSDDPKYQQLVAVHKLIRAKGEKALMDFLLGDNGSADRDGDDAS